MYFCIIMYFNNRSFGLIRYINLFWHEYEYIYYLSGKFNMLPFHELGIVLDVLQLFLTKLIDLIYKSNTGT